MWYIVPYEKNAHFAEFQLTSYILFGGQCIVNRAKYALIQYLGMTEEQAHKYIEQQAMNQRISKRTAAENILKTYENH